MYKIGYRIKLHSQKELQEEFLARYSTLFDTFELKVTNDILCADCMENIINLTETLNIPHYSFHLFKDAMYNEQSLLKTIDLYSSIFNCKRKENLVLVTHYISNDFLDFSNIKLLTYLPNAYLCLENVEVYEGLFEYLENLKCAAIRLKCEICLDFGHLFFSAQKCNISLSIIMEYLEEDIWWKMHIKEIHLHDYNSEKCHLNIGQGFLDLKLVSAFVKDEWPIILETKISDLSTEGCLELKNTKEGLM